MAKTILCYGDSWTYGNIHGLKYAVKKYNMAKQFKVESEHRWGSEAKYFAENPNLLPEAISHTKADYVLLSLGGNDFKNILWKKDRWIAPWTALSYIKRDLRTILNATYTKHPNVEVIMYGYDFMGDIEQDISLSRLFPRYGHFISSAYRWFGVRLVNYYTRKLGDVLQELSTDFAKQGHNMKYYPLWGTLQHALIHGEESLTGDVSYSLAKPSPPKYMNDAIHANYRGFELLMTRLFTNYFMKASSA
ncbi:NDC80 [Acrasis kona]|uniref:NDC80 n=1 Tax=Acrasis kona TaxID=1008807 RepID=A0AAW2ZDK1_9EUKA